MTTDPPADNEVHQLQSRSAHPSGPDASERILLVESDPTLLELLAVVFENDGYTTVAAGAPADAVSILSRSRFDLVITDAFSTTMDAVLASTAELREAVGATPVVLLTAHRPDPHAARAAGFRDLIEKPFDLGAFQDRIRELLPSSSHRSVGDRFAENAGA